MKIKLPLKKNKTQLVNFFKGFKEIEINKMIKASKIKDLDLNKKMFKQKKTTQRPFTKKLRTRPKRNFQNQKKTTFAKKTKNQKLKKQKSANSKNTTKRRF